jgi:2-iminobutanoate/2-iminopropanoate deaminase
MSFPQKMVRKRLGRIRRRSEPTASSSYPDKSPSIRPTQQVISGDVAAQTDRVLKNLSAILNAAGSGLEKVVRSTVFLKNMGDFAAMNEVYGRYFNATPPARSTVEVARLPKDVLVEIDVIALA